MLYGTAHTDEKVSRSDWISRCAPRERDVPEIILGGCRPQLYREGNVLSRLWLNEFFRFRMMRPCSGRAGASSNMQAMKSFRRRDSRRRSTLVKRRTGTLIWLSWGIQSHVRTKKGSSHTQGRSAVVQFRLCLDLTRHRSGALTFRSKPTRTYF